MEPTSYPKRKPAHNSPTYVPKELPLIAQCYAPFSVANKHTQSLREYARKASLKTPHYWHSQLP